MKKYHHSWLSFSLNNSVNSSANFCEPAKNLENKTYTANAFMEPVE